MGSGGRKILASLGKVSMRPYLKNKLKAKGLSMAQVVELLPSKCKALSSLPVTTTITKRQAIFVEMIFKYKILLD
jgi:ribosomal protein L11